MVDFEFLTIYFLNLRNLTDQVLTQFWWMIPKPIEVKITHPIQFNSSQTA